MTRDGLAFETFMWTLANLPISGAWVAYGVKRKLDHDDSLSDESVNFYRRVFGWVVTVQFIWLLLAISLVIP